MQNTPTIPSLPSTSFLSTIHSNFNYIASNDASKFKAVITDHKKEISFEVECTRVTIKTQTTSLTLPKDLWRTLELDRHHSLYLAEEKANNSVSSLPTYLQTIERIRNEKWFHPLKYNKEILFPYSRDINHYGVWWVEDVFSKHAGKNQRPSVRLISKTLFLHLSRRMSTMRTNYLNKMLLSRTTDDIQSKS